jgi:hypothetical protein
MDHEFRLPFGSRPAVGKRWLPIDDGCHSDHCDRGYLRLAYGLDIRGSVELVVGLALDVYAEGRRTSYPAAEGDDPLRNEQDHFLSCVRDRSQTPALDLCRAVSGLKLADAAIESLRLSQEVILPT